jgi:hypothetical protein
VGTVAEETGEFEGTWEEIMSHAAEFAGRRVRLILLPEGPEPSPKGPPLDEKNERMLELYREWQRTPLTEEEVAILDDFEQFRKEHPFSLRRLDDE